MADFTLVIGNKNYSSWSLRGWLMAKIAGIEFEEIVVPLDLPETQPTIRKHSPSGRVPVLLHRGLAVWESLAIAEYLNETKSDAALLPKEPAARAHCRAIAGEMHSGFANLRSALPMNLKAHYPGFKVWAGAQADINRVSEIWHECLAKYGGPFLFGKMPMLADAMYAPVVTRFLTYDVKLDPASAGYCKAVMALPAMQDWVAAAKAEPDEVEELDVEF